MRWFSPVAFALAAAGCSNVTTSALLRPVPEWENAAPIDTTAQRTPNDFATPPATVTFVRCERGWLCGTVAWTNGCVGKHTWALREEYVTIDRPNLPIAALDLSVGTLAAATGGSVTGVVGAGLGRTTRPGGSAAKVSPSQGAGIGLGSTVAVGGIAVDVAALTRLARGTFVHREDDGEVRDRATEDDIGVPCGEADMRALELRIELPHENVEVSLDPRGRFAVDVAKHLPDDPSRLPMERSSCHGERNVRWRSDRVRRPRTIRSSRRRRRDSCGGLIFALSRR